MFQRILCLAIVLSPGALAAVQNDAGSGGDAPAFPASLGVPEGPFSGTIVVSAGDVEDGFSTDPAAGGWRRLVLESPEGLDSVRLGGSGGPLRASASFGPSGTSAEVLVWNGTARGWLRETDVDAPYVGRVDLLQPSDIRILDVRVEDTLVPLQKSVAVSIGNSGVQAEPETLVIAWTEAVDGRRNLGGAFTEVPAGESAVVRVPWDQTGQVGDVVVHALVWPWLDPQGWSDDWQWSGEATVLQSGEGRDLLNGETSGEAGENDPFIGRYYASALGQKGIAVGMSDENGSWSVAAGVCGLTPCVGGGASGDGEAIVYSPMHTVFDIIFG